MARTRRSGTRYRQRYLDLIANDEVRDTFLKRSAIIREIRNFLSERGYVEGGDAHNAGHPGGAAARPFVTHHNTFGRDFFLRIALELYLKRLLVGGIDQYLRSAATSTTKASLAGITRNSPCSRPTRRMAITRP